MLFYYDVKRGDEENENSEDWNMGVASNFNRS